MVAAVSRPRNELEWMRLQARALYTFDPEGRIVAFRDPTGSGAATPIVFLGRTVAGNVWAIRDDVPEVVAEELRALLDLEPAHDGPAEPRHAAALRRCAESVAPIAEEWSGPAFRFGPSTCPERSSPAELRLVEACDVPLVEEAFPQLAGSVAALGPVVAMLQDGRVCSVCRAATAPGPAVEAAVDTVGEARGRGLAARVVAAWADYVRRSGRIPLYSTRWDNAASRAVARNLGLVQYGTDWHLR